MKKHRGVSVDFWTDEKVVSMSPLARLLFMGSWHYCCDGGHLDATPLELKMRVLPADNCDPAELVEEILTAGLYARDEEGRLSVPKLPEHQKIDKRYAIRCERCEDPEKPTPAPRGNHAGSTRGQSPVDHARTTRGAHENPRRSNGEGDGEGDGEGGAGGEGDAAPAATKAPRKRGTRIPDIYPISEEMRQWGREHAPDVDASREHEKFCDYWRGVSGQRGVKVDWFATWRNWMRKAQDDARPNGRGDSDLPDWMQA